MAEKYRLIREYPGSPKLGAIAKLKSCDFYELENSTYYFMTKDKVENYPEFWEKVIEKDYEILSFYEPFTNKILKKDSQLKNQFCVKDGGMPFYNLDKCLINGYKIHSIKRLSDGEVFTIGDKIKSIYEKSYRVIYSINDTTDDKIRIWVDDGCIFWYLENITKLKQPLFTTEDGVDIYKGDKFSTVSLDTMELSTIDGLVGEYATPVKGFKYFSTKEAAKEYIIMNKPCLSINDLEELNNIKKSFQSLGSLSITRNKLKELVKQKLK